MPAAHRLPQGHQPPPVRLRVALGAASLTTSLALVRALQLSPGVGIVLIFVTIPAVYLSLVQYATNRPPRNRKDLPRVPRRLEKVEALASHSLVGLGAGRPAHRPDPVWSTRMTAPSPAPRDPKRFYPFDLETITRAALAICKQRWNFTRYTAMNIEQVRIQWHALNSHQRESYLREANDALRSIDLHATVAELDLWEKTQRRVLNATNPPKDHPVDDAAATVQAIERLIALAEAMPCNCPPAPPEGESDEGEPCQRCQALGRTRDVREQG